LGARKAVTATLTSVLVFSTLLIANQIVYDSENEQLHSATIARLVHTEARNSRLLAANAIFDILNSIQMRIQGSSPACGGWDAYSSGLSKDLETSVTKQGVVYSLNVSARYANAGPPEDNLTLLRPYNGYENGSLNFVVHVSMRASAGKGHPYFEKSETHFVHLPVVTDRTSRLCTSTTKEIGRIPSSPSVDAQLGFRTTSC
jgi:hypothetical protein